VTVLIYILYSDDYQAALKYLKDTETNLHNILIMAGNFNIRDRKWDSFYLFYSTYSDFLLEVTDSLELKLSSSIYQVPTHYTNNSNNSNLVINFMFLHPNSVEINNHYILSEIQYSLDHVPLTINISIIEEYI